MKLHLRRTLVLKNIYEQCAAGLSSVAVKKNLKRVASETSATNISQHLDCSASIFASVKVQFMHT